MNTLEAIKEMKAMFKYAKKVSRTKESAEKFLKQMGMLSKKGKLKYLK